MWQATRKRLRNSSNAGVRIGLAPQADEGKTRIFLLSEQSTDAFSGAKSSSSIGLQKKGKETAFSPSTKYR